MTDSLVSRRATTVAAVKPFHLLMRQMEAIDYFTRRDNPDVLDFTFGDPREMPSERYVATLREAALPRNEGWFAYTFYERAAQDAAAASLSCLSGLPFTPDDICLTTGGFAALAVGMKVVADPGDEIIYSLPPWFFYEGLAVEAGLVPVKVGIDPETLDLDLDAIAAAITPRTRIVIVNSPNNPTGRIYSPDLLTRLAAILEAASARIGRRIFILSDEPYNRIVFQGSTFHTPAEFYPYTLIAYSYGKTLLSPGQRIGYLALPPALPEREALREAIRNMQIAIGFAFPNALLQHALPDLEQQSIDIPRLERRRDMMVDALTAMGYRVNRPEGTFYLFPRSPIADDEAFTRRLAEENILVMPGTVFETPGFFRICLTATEEMCERSLPGFAAAIEGV
ncbi:MAG: aminotransferase class I/II-fold pyridoxal phosphate-dependent enzyme [Thermomicrobiales bacterium]